MNNTYQVDSRGYYGDYGGSYIPEILHSNVQSLAEQYLEITQTADFREELDTLLQHYVGRPTPLYFSQKLSELHGCSIFLKREDLNHTGAHKINNALGQVLIAKKMNKKRIIAETGAGQHGVATATACALFNMKCVIYMGEEDIRRQAPNVARMHMLGAQVIPAISGSRTLKDATNEAIRDWINNPDDSYYVIGSVVGPHPYPDMVARFQSIISKEIKQQLYAQKGVVNPDYVIACIGGGSNASGAFYHFLDEEIVRLIGVEAAGKGVDTSENAATLSNGSPGIIHGSKTYLMQNDDGQIMEPYSISAGLDYPGVGPMHSFLKDVKRAQYYTVTDDEAVMAAFKLCTMEGIIPALESAHALAILDQLTFESSDIVVVNLSGRGDKDLDSYLKYKNNSQ